MGRPTTLILFLAFATALPSQENMVEVHEWAYKQGLSFWWEPLGGLGLLHRNNKSLVFLVGDTMALFDGQVWVAAEFHRDANDHILLSQETAKRLEKLGAPPEPWRGRSWRIGAILIDAGHGGRDPGTVSPYRLPNWGGPVQEKDTVLKVARELSFICRNRGLAPQVVLTRDDDSYLSLAERVELAHAIRLNEWEIIVFISIHANASLNREAKGVEVWYIPGNYERDVLSPETEIAETLRPLINSLQDYEYKVESRRLAELVREMLSRQTTNQTVDRGLREEAWFVFRMARMPAILVEIGFVTSEDEAKLLTQDDYLKKLAEAMYDGLHRFSVELENGMGGNE